MLTINCEYIHKFTNHHKKFSLKNKETNAENHNQIKCRVMEQSTNGHMYKRSTNT